MLYGTVCWATKKQRIHKISIANMRILRWISEKTRKDWIRNEEIRLKIQVTPLD